MKRLQNALAPAGLMLAAGALLWHRSGRELPGDFVWWVVTGLALVLVHLALRWDDVSEAIGARQLLHGGNALVLTVLVLGILVGLNWVANQRKKRWDLTENRRYSLSDQTRKAVSGLDTDVTLTYFGTSEEMAGARARLDDYAALSDHLKVEYVDPVADPVKARSFAAQPPWPILFVDRGDRRERITSDSENDVTNALLKVVRDVEKTVCFVEGEGERDTEDRGDTGLSSIGEALQKQYAVKKITLIREQQVPSDCTVTVVAGPHYDMLPPVVDALRRYVKGGGALLAMLEPPLDGDQPNLDALLADWDIEVGKNVVIDVSGKGLFFGTNELTPIADAYNYHEITKDFRVATAFSTARSVEAGQASVPGVVAQDLVQTSPQAWAETDLSLKALEPTQGVDKMGPISLAAVATVEVEKPAGDAEKSAVPEAAEKDAAEGSDEADAAGGDGDAAAGAEDEKPAPRNARVVAFGDVDFASNQMLPIRGNQDLFLNTVAWLAEDADLISIRPKEPTDQRLFLTELEQQNLALLALLLIPGLFVVGGVATWWSRR